MALGITATPNSSQAYVSLTGTGLNAANQVSIIRNNPDGSTSHVRGVNSYPTGGAATLAFFDYESPLDRTVTYTMVADQAAVNANPYFETGISGWFAVGGSVAWDTTVKHGSANSMKLTPNGTSSSPHAEDQGIAVKAGDQFTVQGWFYTPNAYAAGAAILVSWYDTNHAYKSGTTVGNAATTAGTWTFKSGTVTAPQDGYAGISGQLSGTPAVTDLLYISALELVDTTFPAAVSSAVRVVTDGQTFWLKNVAQESLSRTVTVSAMTAVTRPARVLATYSVLGRANPVVVSDVRSGRKGTVTLTTNSVQDADDLRALFSQGYPLLFQAPASTNFPDMYFSAGDITETWMGVASSLTRTFDIPFTEVDAPVDSLVAVGSNSWTVVSQFGTWANLKNKRTTWLDVLNRPFTQGDAG